MFTGDYKTWEEAQSASQGYSAANILEKTRQALLQVKRGEMAFERDSLAFPVMEHRFPLLASLLRAAIASEGRLSILDFGGALGGTYFQCAQFLSTLSDLRWSVVDQENHVACGAAEFADQKLCFYSSVKDCLRSEEPTVLLLSGVLQYLPQPYEFLGSLLKYPWHHVIVDRTGFFSGQRDILTIQNVPDSICHASYPAWFFHERQFVRTFSKDYRLITDFEAIDSAQLRQGKVNYKGFIFERRDLTRHG